MTTTRAISAVHGWSQNPDPEGAIREILGSGPPDDPSLGIVFASANYDLDALARAIPRNLPCPVIGCSTAGEVAGGGYMEGGISLAVISGVDARVASIGDARSFTEAKAAEVARRLGTDSLNGDESAVLITLMDGLCMREEWLSAFLYAATGGVPMVGGSSGDNLTFSDAVVYENGAFRPRGGVCALVSAPSGIRTFIAHHYADTGTRLVVTRADPDQRQVFELNGLPALDAYADALGVDPANLSKLDELLHPLMMSAGDHLYVRGVQRVLDDKSIKLFCAIEEGVVLHVGRSNQLVSNLESAMRAASAGMTPSLVLAFDCITRRLETNHAGTHQDFARAMSAYPVVGFSTYGEQYNGVHVNQTVTGAIFGAEA